MACRRTADDLVLVVAKVEKQTTAVAGCRERWYGMKAYACDVCGAVITDPYSAKMTQFCLAFSNTDFYGVPEKHKIKTKIHLCNNCFKGFKGIAKEKMRREKRGETDA